MRQTKKTLIPLVCFGLFITGYYLITLQFTIADIARDNGLDDFLMGLIITIQYIAMILLPIPLGNLSDKYGKKVIFYIQSIAFVVGNILIAASGQIVLLFLGVLIAGAGYGLMSFLSVAVVTDAYPEKASRFVHISSIAFCVGAVAAPLVSNMLMENGMAWRGLYLIICIAGVIGLAVLCFTKVEKVALAGREEMPKQKIRGLLKSPLLWMLGITIILYLGIETGASMIDSFFENVYPESEAGYSALSLSLFWFMFIPARMITGMWKKSKTPILVAAFVLCIVDLIVLSAIRMPVISVIGCAVLGFGCGPIWPTLMSLGSRTFYENSGLVSGISTSCTALGGAVSAPIMSGIAGWVGYEIVFLVVGAFAALGLIMYLITRKLFKQKGFMKLL